jgi:hypothetical protein
MALRESKGRSTGVGKGRRPEVASLPRFHDRPGRASSLYRKERATTFAARVLVHYISFAT